MDLNPFECLVFREILSDLKDQIEQSTHSIVESKSGSISKRQTDSPILKQSPSTKLKSDEDDLLRIRHDLERFVKIIEQTTTELETSHSFSTLSKTDLYDEESRIAPINSMAENQATQRNDENLVKKLEKELKTVEESGRTRNREQLSLINELKDEIHLAKQKREKDSDFVQVWLKARNDFDQGVLHKNEILGIKSQIRNMNETEERDCESYENVMAWTKLRVTQLEKNISNWKDKLVKDVKSMNRKISRRKAHIGKQELEIAALQELINQRIQELIPWEEEKQQERLERIQHMRKYYSCRNIQRWWRKYMVQHNLYKKKKPKPKPNASKAKPKLEGKVKAKSPRKKSS